MKIVILYVTTEGQTRKISRFCMDVLYDHGHSIELLHMRDADHIDLTRFDAAILAASVHVGAYQSEVTAFASEHAAVLGQMKSLFLAVSLAAAGDVQKEHDDLNRIAARFARHTGWQPGQVMQVAGALKFSEYNFFKGWIMDRIANQHDRDHTKGEDTEYTDWARLKRVLDDWQVTPA